MNLKALTILETLSIPAAASVESLGKGRALSLQSTGRLEVYCVSGTLWVTREGDPLDYVVKAGGKRLLEGPGRIVVSALEESRIWIG